jgi:centrin-3
VNTTRRVVHCPKGQETALLRPEFSDEQKQEIKEAFELFDTDKDGCVD